jgi:enoyl-CoA hydratase/carnithine racemase
MVVLYEKEKKIVTITLNRPDRLNRIDAEIFQAFSTALLELAFFEKMLQSEDYKEGLRALAEGRKPEYKGQR